MKTILHKLLAAAKHAGNLLLSRIRDFNRALRQKDRSVRTRYTYAALSLGTVVIAYLLVLLNRGVFALTEHRLFNHASYESVNIVSAGGISDPLSRAVRVALFASCEFEGEERATLPEEVSRAEAVERIRQLWEQTLSLYAPGGRLATGEEVSRVLAASKYTARLRDFYNDETSAKIAVWGAQAYYTAAGGRVYCLSAELDSRTNDIYSMTLALFENIDGTDPASDFYPFLDALNEPRSAADGMIVTQTPTGTETTLTLSDGLRLVRETQRGSQIYLYITE